MCCAWYLCVCVCVRCVCVCDMRTQDLFLSDSPLPHLPFPGTYIPQKEVEVIEIIQATVIKQNQALRLRARKECLDRDGKERVTGGVLKCSQG